MVTGREREVLGLIREDPMMSQQGIAKRLGISRSAVAGHVMNLTNKGIIKGRGYVLGEHSFVVVVGGANMDIHGKSLQALRDNDSNPGTVVTTPGGVARNVAENLARLGVDCRLVSAVGNDQHGRVLLQHGRNAGIDMQHVETIASASTSTYMSVLDESGDMQLAISDMSIIDLLGPERLRLHRAMIEQSSLIILDANLPDRALGWLADTFAAKTLFADTVSTTKAVRLRPHLAAIHTLKMSRIEFEALTGLELRRKTQLRKASRSLHEQGVERVFVTLGDRGVFFSTRDDEHGTYQLKGEKQRVRNTGGAGDAFIAGLAYAWLENWPLEESMQVALAAAAVTVADPATSSPSLSVAAVNRAMEAHRALL